MDLKLNHLAFPPVFTVRVLPYEFLETFQGFLIIFVFVPGMGINNAHLEKNSVRCRGMFLQDLLIFGQGSLVFPLVEIFICFPGERPDLKPLVDGAARAYQNRCQHDAGEVKANAPAFRSLPSARMRPRAF